ncbi:hypothetical protein ElyMa_001068300 [Elysia marginata]|uniref:AIG1-type G domain-containing protein n=1 Tax=Elysia marginata TaxID=1093978 RepID=A0AAV4HUR0_9GAST|nr:hypothetical protein ElyMa_001068300 [Elysia marginata]
MLKELMIISHNECSAFLYIIKYPLRVTEDDVKDIEMLEEILKKDMGKLHGVLVMTGGDSFDADNEDGDTFEAWCARQSGHFKELKEKFENRVVLFDSVTQNEINQCRQLDSLLTEVARLQGFNNRYTDDNDDDNDDDDFESANLEEASDDSFHSLLTTLQRPLECHDLPALSSECARHIRLRSGPDAEKLRNIKVLLDKTFREQRRSPNSRANGEDRGSTLEANIRTINYLAGVLVLYIKERAAKASSKTFLQTTAVGVTAGVVLAPFAPVAAVVAAPAIGVVAGIFASWTKMKSMTRDL